MSTITLPDGREVDEQLYRERFEHPCARLLDRDEYQPCRFCLRPAIKCVPPDGVPLHVACGGCMEVSSGLEGFLRDGGGDAQLFVYDQWFRATYGETDHLAKYRNKEAEDALRSRVLSSGAALPMRKKP